MNRDDIIRMAEQAGFVIDQEAKKYQPNCISHTHYLIDEPLTRFAELVAAAEREECAQLCDRVGFDHEDEQRALLAFDLATTIRARGEK